MRALSATEKNFIHEAVKDGDLETLKKVGKSVFFQQFRNHWLHKASKKHLKIAKFLIQSEDNVNANADSMDQDDDQQTPLHNASKKYWEILDFLIQSFSRE